MAEHGSLQWPCLSRPCWMPLLGCRVPVADGNHSHGATTKAAIALMSACIPAPPELSEPVMGNIVADLLLM